jgi:hypothetical protein
MKIQILCAVAISLPALGQGTFRNLGFEEATVPDLPPGPFGELVATANGIPGWRAWTGTNDFGVMGHNVDILGYSSALPAILGPNQDPNQILQGRYTVLLHSGVNSTLDQIVPSSISQVGTIPFGATTLRFRVFVYGAAPYSVTIDQVPLSLVPVFAGPKYTLVEANITPLSGQTGELRFTAFPSANNNFNSVLVDDIVFVPEPSVFGLFALGALLLVWRFARQKH